jgi:hypothetical protein
MADTSSSSGNTGGYRGAGETRPGTAVKDKAREDASSLATKAKEAGATAIEKGKEAGSAAIDKTKDAVSSFVGTMEDMASTIGHQAEGAVGATGGAMKSLAGTIRDKGPESGMLHNVTSGVASGLESGGAYLQDHNLHGMAKDVTDLVRRYPLQAILVGVGVGFCVGRLSRS